MRKISACRSYSYLSPEEYIKVLNTHMGGCFVTELYPRFCAPLVTKDGSTTGVEMMMMMMMVMTMTTFSMMMKMMAAMLMMMMMTTTIPVMMMTMPTASLARTSKTLILPMNSMMMMTAVATMMIIQIRQQQQPPLLLRHCHHDVYVPLHMQILVYQEEGLRQHQQIQQNLPNYVH